MIVIRLILKGEKLFQSQGQDFNSAAEIFFNTPFLELLPANAPIGSEIFSNLPPPRAAKTHLPFPLLQDVLQKHPEVKVIQTMRNPKDALVSYYYQLQSMVGLGSFTGSWDQFFQLYKEKKLPWGDYFQHTVEWYKFNKDRANSLVIKYEDMLKDHKAFVIKIATFLGHQLSDSLLEQIVQKSSLQDMKKDFNVFFFRSPVWEGKSEFIRKGIVGDWVNYFSPEQSDFVDAQCEEHLEPLGITFDFCAHF